MRIIAASDIHGDFETFDKLGRLLKTSDAEVLTISGDLIGPLMNGAGTEYYQKISSGIAGIANGVYEATKGEVNTYHDVAEFLMNHNVTGPDGKVVDDFLRLGKEYLKFEEDFEKHMDEQYAEFRQRFDDLEQEVVLVPGNWDGNRIDDHLDKENISRKDPKDIEGVKFAGYGGANEHPFEIPVDKKTWFNEYDMFEHFSKYDDAEVVITHTPPRVLKEFPGEYSVRAVMERNAPGLLLAGHIHGTLCVREPRTGTLIVNPGNLGKYEGQKDYGTFAEVDINENLYVNPIGFHDVRSGQGSLKLKLKNPELAPA